MNKKLLVMLTVGLFAQKLLAGVPVSITQFKDKSGSSNCRYNWSWWQESLGTGFQEMLADELMKSGQIELYERETINEMYEGEHNLVNSSEDRSLKKGQFKKAKYTFVGAVTDFEYCASKNSTSVNVGAVAGLFGVSAPDVSVGLKGAKAKIGIDLRVVDTTTGRVLKTIHTEATAEDSKFDLDSNYGDFSSQENSPMGVAARKAIAQAASESLKVIK